MKFLNATSPEEFAQMSTEDLRERFLLDNLFAPGELNLVETAEDRLVIGGAVPNGKKISLIAPEEMNVSYFCENREVAVICLSGEGSVTVDGTEYKMGQMDVLYVGLGSKDVEFAGEATFYIFSALAHKSFPTALCSRDEATAVHLGSKEAANERTIRKYIHAEGLDAAQLVVGITELEPGSVWNTIPAHVHRRRTEVYLYSNLPENAQVVHLCGEPQSTKHIMMSNNQVVVSPSWSIHAGAGTSNYWFVWAMGGENRDYNDVVWVPEGTLR
jgi:4-deoxy-L-threo-5-hexosulose-uronate ketol-isomerase